MNELLAQIRSVSFQLDLLALSDMYLHNEELKRMLVGTSSKLVELHNMLKAERG